MKLEIRVSNNSGYLWDVSDIQLARVQHHLCGTLTGTLPQLGQQNVFLGVPLLLLPEEVVLLVENGLAVLTDDSKAHRPPTEREATSYHSSRTNAIASQREKIVSQENEHRRKMEELFRDKIERKRLEREREKDKRFLKPDSSSSSSSDLVVVDHPLSTSPLPSGKTETATNNDESKKDISTVPYSVVIQPSSTDLPWYDTQAGGATCKTLDEARTLGLWTYPNTPLERSRCKVFEDLWKRGFYMGVGLRFGGDFLVYPGDPLRYHSHFTLTVLESPESPIMPLDLVGYGRLATAVKKAHLLASWDQESNEVTYFSLEWAAFG